MKPYLAAAFAFICLVAAGCSTAKDETAAGNFTAADLEKLRWLEGTWRGSDASGQGQFFERIRFGGNGRIEIDSLSDATSGTSVGQSSIVLSGGSIFHQNGGVIWEADKLNSSMVSFVPKDKSAEAFVFEKVNADSWISKKFGKDAQGNPRETVYKMERIK